MPWPPCQSGGNPPGASKPGPPLRLAAEGSHSDSRPKARLCPPQPFFPSVSPGGREVRTEKETGSGRALCSGALAPQDLGLLSTESAQGWCWLPGSPEDQTTGRAPSLGCPPTRSWVIITEWEGGPHRLRALLCQQPPPSSSLKGVKPRLLGNSSQPKGRGHAAQPGNAVTHSSPVFRCHTCEWPLTTRTCPGPWRKGYRPHREVAPRQCWPDSAGQTVLGWGFHDPRERQDKSLASA